MGKIYALCISDEKGTAKYEKESVRVIEDYGFENDAHAGKWHRQVSLLSRDSVEDFEAKKDGVKIAQGAFGENILVTGMDLAKLPIGTILVSGDVRLEISQIGKECHHGCDIRKTMGDCIMPREGIFAKVLSGGTLARGDEIEIESYPPYKLGIITVSDKGYAGKRKDESGDEIEKIFRDKGFDIGARTIVPDKRGEISAEIKNFTDDLGLDLILTTGGTGLSPRDITPEATLDVIDKNVPGIAEAMRLYSSKFTNRAMLSRAVSGIRGSSLIINLPGSVKAVRENIEAFEDSLDHGLGILKQRESECGRKN